MVKVNITYKHHGGDQVNGLHPPSVVAFMTASLILREGLTSYQTNMYKHEWQLVVVSS